MTVDELREFLLGFHADAKVVVMDDDGKISEIRKPFYCESTSGNVVVIENGRYSPRGYRIHFIPNYGYEMLLDHDIIDEIDALLEEERTDLEKQLEDMEFTLYDDGTVQMCSSNRLVNNVFCEYSDKNEYLENVIEPAEKAMQIIKKVLNWRD